jgi:hypothetical protein
MTTKTNRRAEVEAWRRLAQSIALAAIYVTAAEKGAKEGASAWSAGELLNAARAMRDGAKTAAGLAATLTGKRVKP